MRGFRLGARRRDVLKALPGPCQNGGRARCCFEPPKDHIAVGRIIFDQPGKPPRLLRGDHCRPGTAERIKDDGRASAAVLDRVSHEVDGLDRRVQFEVVQTPFPEGIDAGIVPNIRPVSTCLTEAKRVHMLCGPDLEHENRLTHVNALWVVSSTGAPWWVTRLYMGDPVRRQIARGIKPLVGRKASFRMLTLYDMDRMTETHAGTFLDRLEQAFRRF